MEEKHWYVYMLRCADDSLYTGMTNDISKRLRAHLSRSAQSAKYTRSRPVTALAALWQVPDEHTARSLEWHIKHLPRARKLQLIRTPETITALCELAMALPAELNAYLDEKTHASK